MLSDKADGARHCIFSQLAAYAIRWVLRIPASLCGLVPCNQFANQDPADDEGIGAFCVKVSIAAIAFVFGRADVAAKSMAMHEPQEAGVPLMGTRLYALDKGYWERTTAPPMRAQARQGRT